MNFPQHEPQAVPEPTRAFAGPGANGLLLSRDLIFTTKIKATAAELGYLIQVASDVISAESLITSQRPRVILIDLTAGDLCAPKALRAYRRLAGSDAWLVAFGPHVDADSLALAKAAGCQIAIPRSRFASELPDLIQRVLQSIPVPNPLNRSCERVGDRTNAPCERRDAISVRVRQSVETAHAFDERAPDRAAVRNGRTLPKWVEE